MWVYNGKVIKSHDDLLENCSSFVYIITYTNGQQYIGKKQTKSVRKRPPLKGKKRCRRKLVNLPFINYEGSSEHTEGLTVDKKEILYQCSSKNAASYLETALLFHYDALFDDKYLNRNINGTYFDSCLDGLLKGPTEAETETTGANYDNS